MLKVTDVEIRQCVIDKAMQGTIRAVRVLVDQSRDEVRGKGDDKSLQKRTYYCLHDQNTILSEPLPPGNPAGLRSRINGKIRYNYGFLLVSFFKDVYLLKLTLGI